MSEFLNSSGAWIAQYLPVFGIIVLPIGLYLTGRYFGKKAGYEQGLKAGAYWTRIPAKKPRKKPDPKSSASRIHHRYGPNEIRTAPGPRDWSPNGETI